MVTRREQYRYDKWLDSLEEGDYQLAIKVIDAAVQDQVNKAFAGGLISGAIICGIIILVGLLVGKVI